MEWDDAGSGKQGEKNVLGTVKNGKRILSGRNPYIWVGLCLLVVGVTLVLTAIFVLGMLTWLTALGISLLIISFIMIALSRTVPDVPPEVSLLLMEAGSDNISAIVEELGINSKPVYIPASMAGGKTRALIPLRSDLPIPEIKTSLPQRLIVRYGPEPDDVGLLMTTAGTAATGILEGSPGTSEGELEAALTSLIQGRLGAADRIQVAVRDLEVMVVVHGSRIGGNGAGSLRGLDSSLASVVASVVAEAFEKPVIVNGEEHRGRRCNIELRVAA